MKRIVKSCIEKKNNQKILFTLFLILCLIVPTTCKKLEKSMLVSTGEVSNILTNSADVTGIVIDLGNGATQHGHCYATTANVTISGTKTELGQPPAGGFTSQLTDLVAGTKYYIKAYISDGSETVYGKEISFTTLQGSAPSVTTEEISSVTSTTALSGGNVEDDGGAAVTVRGVCWNTATGPSISNSKTTDGEGTGSFTSNLSDLTPGTTYYVRAYATNSAGTTYGDELDFVTLDLNPPTAITEPATSVTGSTATLNGTVNANGKSTAVTFEYGLTTGYGSSVTASESPVSGTNLTAVSAVISSLSVGATYHFRVKAVSSDGTTYGEDQTFTTNCTAPSATTIDATLVLSTTATLNGIVNANNFSTTVTFEYGTTTGYGNSVAATQSPVAGMVSVAVSAEIISLSPNTQYHYRVKTVNCGGTINGLDQTFTTLCTAPSAITNSATNLGTATATLNSTVNANNFSTTVTFDYGTTISYGSTITATQSPVTGSSNTAVSAGVTGLTPNTLYHFRVNTVNCGGTIYGTDQTFTTLCSAPSATTNAATLVSNTTATLNGTVNANNFSTTVTFDYGTTISYGSTITATQSPVTGSSNTAVSAGVTGLTPNTLYHFRVNTVNCGGTIYGTDMNFTSLASVTTTAISNITSTTASTGGSIAVGGGANITARGVCWSTSSGPTIALATKTSDGSSTGTFTSSITALTLGVTYYVRAYATNSEGTAYGNEINFTTALAIGESYQGGKIAYILQPGDPGYIAGQTHGLIAAPYDQSTGAVWGCYGTTIAGADGTAIGTGNQNTIDIMAGCSTAGIAARLCGDLLLGGYNDWYLPSKDELNKLYINMAAIGGFANNYYWSSTEYVMNTNAWGQGFFDGGQGSLSKDLAKYVRAIRAF